MRDKSRGLRIGGKGWRLKVEGGGVRDEVAEQKQTFLSIHEFGRRVLTAGTCLL